MLFNFMPFRSLQNLVFIFIFFLLNFNKKKLVLGFVKTDIYDILFIILMIILA